VGDQLQKGLVDAAEFFGAEVAEVDAAQAAAAARADQSQGADGRKQGLVRETGTGQRLVQRAGLKDAADAGQG
jgi:hypothetical protein